MRRTIWRTVLGAAAATTIVAVGAPGAQANSVNNSLIGAGPGPGPSVKTAYQLQSFGGKEGWIVSAPTVDDGRPSPQQVYLDPQAGPWVKILSLRGDLVDSQPGPTIDTPQPPTFSYVLKEFLKVGAAPAWTDWHESVSLHLSVPSNPGLTLQPDPTIPVSFSHVQVSTLQNNSFKPLKGTKVRLKKNSASILFPNPLPVGTTLQITKLISFGLLGAPASLDQQQIDGNNSPYLLVKEFPTSTVPTPAALWGGLSLLLLAGLWTMRRRRAMS